MVLQIRNDVKEWYTLKKKSLLKRGEGEIQLSFNLQYHKVGGDSATECSGRAALTPLPVLLPFFQAPRLQGAGDAP